VSEEEEGRGQKAGGVSFWFFFKGKGGSGFFFKKKGQRGGYDFFAKKDRVRVFFYLSSIFLVSLPPFINFSPPMHMAGGSLI